MQSTYANNSIQVNHSVGIDTSEIHVARIGVRGEGDNDLVWVGRAANRAAKLTALGTPEYPIWVSQQVYLKMNPPLRNYVNGNSAWEARTWKTMNDSIVYRTNGTYELD